MPDRLHPGSAPRRGERRRSHDRRVPPAARAPFALCIARPRTLDYLASDAGTAKRFWPQCSALVAERAQAIVLAGPDGVRLLETRGLPHSLRELAGRARSFRSLER